MKERPILFSAPMVRAILSGAKTQTRRVVRPSAGLQSTWTSVEKLAQCPTNYLCEVDGQLGAQFQHPLAGQFAHGVYNEKDSPYGWFKCPYGKAGDRLWVKETRWVNGGYPATDDANFANEGKKPSIFCRRHESRLLLEITDVRAERLLQISAWDATLEGMEPHCDPDQLSAIEQFKRLWEQINGKKYPWASNPWVWVIGFRRIENA